MSYCMCENTYADLRDVYDEVNPEQLSESEKKYFAKLVKLCKKIADEYGEDED